MASGCQKWGSFILATLRNIFLELITIILGIGFMFIIPFTLLSVSIPFGLFRYGIKMLAKCIRPDLGKMVTLAGQFFTTELLYTRPLSNIVVGFVWEGNLDIKTVKDKLARNVLKSTLPNGELKYIEMKQYLSSWMGYFFWKEDKTFDLDRHLKSVNVNNLSTYSDSDVHEFFQKQFLKPWSKNRPVWEINVITNYYPEGPQMSNAPHSVMFFNFHHSLADGYSLVNFSRDLFEEDGTFGKVPKPTYARRSFLKRLGYFMTFPFMVGYEAAQIAVKGLSSLPFAPKNLNEKFHTIVTDQISVEKVKEIKNHFRVSFASVINAIEAGSLRDFLITKGHKFPEGLFQLIALPLPRDTEKLRNYSTGGNCILPVGEPDPVKRLEFCSKDYLRLKHSVSPKMARLCFMVLGTLPTVISRPLMYLWSLSTPITTGISVFPFGYHQRSFDGCKAVDAFFAAGTGPVGMVLYCMSYMDGLRITVQCKESVMTKEELTNFSRLFQKHVDILHDKIVKEV